MDNDELAWLSEEVQRIISDHFDKMPNAGTTEWDLQKVAIINEVRESIEGYFE